MITYPNGIHRPECCCARCETHPPDPRAQARAAAWERIDAIMNAPRFAAQRALARASDPPAGGFAQWQQEARS